MRTTLVLALSIVACSSSSSAPLDEPVPESRARNVAANRLCDEWRRCDCGDAAGVSLSGCETGLGFAWDASAEEAAALGLTYDGACLMRRLNAILERGCSTEPSSIDCGPETCQIYYGTLPEGADCEGGVSASNCAQGLICLGTCAVPCSLPSATPLMEGERCREGDEVTGFCDMGLLCDTTSELCTALPGPDQPCLMGSLCEQGSYCDFMQDPATCEAQVEPGATCMTAQQCTTFACDGSTCSSFPGEGEPCTRGCMDALACVPDGAGTATCQRIPGRGEPCLAETVVTRCMDGLACADGTCVEPPGEGESCMDPSAGSLISCAGDLICGARSCRFTPSAPGCDECADPEGGCTVRVCQPVPAAVCGDSGGVLIVL